MRHHSVQLPKAVIVAGLRPGLRLLLSLVVTLWLVGCISIESEWGSTGEGEQRSALENRKDSGSVSPAEGEGRSRPAPGRGEEVNEAPPDDASTGRWRRRRVTSSSEDLTDEQRRIVEELESIGYLKGSASAPEQDGVTIYNTEKAYNGLNLYTSGHGPEAFLVDMNGDTLHSWKCDFKQVWPGRRTCKENEYWRRAYLFENGDLLAVYDGEGLIRLDRYSNLLWSYGGGSHHDLEVTADGKIYVLDREIAIIPQIHQKIPTVEDFVTVLDLEGNLLKRVSLIECFENSWYAPVLKRLQKKGDIFHTNTVHVFDGSLVHRSPLFARGNVLISILYLDTIAIVDLEEEAVVWTLSGLWYRQHQPTPLEDGRFIIFDNHGRERNSRVYEFDPFTQEIFWMYEGDPPEGFYSGTCGSCQRLPNGNTLITESDQGRAFEVSRDETIEWEFLNPCRAGENNELIATLFEMVRLPPDFPLDWLDGTGETDSPPDLRDRIDAGIGGDGE